MKKVLTILMSLFFLCILSSFATAYADITYHFNTDYVEALAFDCDNEECSQVSDFSGSFPNGKTTYNGRLMIEYPSTLQTEHGYAVYFVSPGYLPKEGRSYIHTNGNDGHAEDDAHIDFNKKDECQSIIDDFSIRNDVYANEPLQVNVSSSLDAETASAFKESHADPKFDVEYVPDEFKDRYYSSDVEVDLTIENSSEEVVETQTREFSWNNGNPIYMDETKDLHFDWTPQDEGEHIANVSTKVIDAQCESSLESSAFKYFDVLPERPTNECYTLLNNLDFDNTQPMVGDKLNFTFNKISNYADEDHQKHPTETLINYGVYNSSNEVVENDDMIMDANENAEDPENGSFTFTPESSGQFSVVVEGVCHDNRCEGIENHKEKLALQFNVEPRPTYEVEFEVSDSESHFPLENVSIDMNNTVEETNEDGITTFTGLLPGDYSYKATKENYENYSSSIEVVDEDQKITFTMVPEDDDDEVEEYECNDDIDNDGDGLVDMDDPGCDSTDDDNESDNEDKITFLSEEPPTTAFVGVLYEYEIEADSLVTSDLEYNKLEGPSELSVDGEGNVEWTPTSDDLGEHYVVIEVSDGYNNRNLSWTINVTRTECNDGIDNDGDGLVDMNDPGCNSPQDNDEFHVISSSVTFSSNVTSGLSPLAVEFTCEGSGEAPFEYNIDYGDGDTESFTESGSVSTVHEYDSGNYTAVCNVTGADGGSDEDTIDISIQTPECNDGVDNDGDGLTDMNDPGCDSPQDNNESDGTSECQDGVDNDGDGLVDMNDPGCDSPQDNDESDGTSECQDGVDNDGDGLTDMNDPGCDSPQDNNESDGTSECQDGIDNDGDGLVDMNDPGCDSPQDNNESDGTSECQDGIDNDGDGLVDMNDPGCDSPQDNNESDGTSECQDGIDNDGDGLIDMNDPGCDSPQDNDEFHVISASVTFSSNVTSGLSPLSVELTCSANGAEPFEYNIDYGDGDTESFTENGSVSTVHEYDTGDYTAVCNVTGADGASDGDSVDISVQTPECDDGIDNDGDGLVDMNDPGCDSPQDNDESDGTSECQDGIDNDGDGLVDMNDPGCDIPQDNSEDDSQEKLEFTSGTPPGTAYVSVLYNHDVDAESMVNSNIEYEKFKGPEDLSIDNEGKIEWTPLPHDIGEHEVVIEATDGFNTRYLSWTINVESKQPESDVKRKEVVVSQVRYPSGTIYSPGDIASLTMRIDNTGDYDLDRLQIMLMSYGFGLIKRESFTEVDEGEQVNKRVNFRIPENARRGQHMLRIKLKGEDVKYTTHRPIEVR